MTLTVPPDIAAACEADHATVAYQGTVPTDPGGYVLWLVRYALARRAALRDSKARATPRETRLPTLAHVSDAEERADLRADLARTAGVAPDAPRAKRTKRVRALP